jgi:hypothetical protein
MRKFQAQAHRFLSLHGVINNLFPISAWSPFYET